METSRVDLEELLARCLAGMEAEGDAALERLCQEHSSHAAELRAHVQALLQFGMLGAKAGAGPDRIPERLGDFRLIRRIGGGGMGVVYLAEQTSLKWLSSPAIRRLMQREDLKVRLDELIRE